MSSTSRTVLLLLGRTQLANAVEAGLARAGFDVVRIEDARKLLVTARERAPVALGVAGLTGPAVRRFKRDPMLRHVPIVSFVRRGSRPSSLWWPFVAADAYVEEKELARAGAVADEVRTAIERGVRGPPTRRERAGAALWNVGVALDVGGMVALPFALGAAVLLALRQVVSGPNLLLVPIFAIAAGDVLRDGGGRVGLGRPLRLRWTSWIWIGLVAMWVLAWARNR